MKPNAAQRTPRPNPPSSIMPGPLGGLRVWGLASVMLKDWSSTGTLKDTLVVMPTGELLGE